MSTRSSEAATPAPVTSPPSTRSTTHRRRGTAGQRFRVAVLEVASWLACRLPEQPLAAIAGWVGSAWYRLAPERAAQGRANLRRVVGYLAANGLGSDRVATAAVDPRALETMLRDAFRHNARYYLEILRAPALKPEVFSERTVIETPEVLDEAFAAPNGTVFVSPHFGPIELPAFYIATRSGRRVVAPMEAVGDPALQAWFERTRSGFGVRIIGLREARRELGATLGRGEIVGVVGDRDIAGGGLEVPFFGSPAPVPIGPALLAIEAGVALYAAAARWDPAEGAGHYRGGATRVEIPADGSRRDRVAATVAAEARAFERLIAADPAQWSAIFFPIWADLGWAEDAPVGAPAEAAPAGAPAATDKDDRS
jgi:lauroyl/myristoyl acyltransferase